ncbi:replication protein RepA, partial [Dokdonella soli]
EAALWWNPKVPGQDTLWQSYVVLSKRFFDAITDSPVPLDMRALRVLKNSPLALDLYAWTTYRMSYLRRRTDIPWKALQLQFGADYADTAQGRQGFKRKLLQALTKVHTVYPALRLEVEQDGIQLIPSSTHVKQLQK